LITENVLIGQLAKEPSIKWRKVYS